MGDLPPARSAPCQECPWRRSSAPGHLGPHTAQEWSEAAHSEAPIACHMTIPPDCGEADWEEDDLLQCAGAARFRRNVSKLPRNPQVAVAKFRSPTIFGSSREFIEHHTNGG